MAEDQALLDRITKLEATNTELRTLVTELKTELDATEKRLDEIEKSQGGAAAAGGGGDEGEGKSKKQAKKDAKAAKKGKGKGKEMPPGGWPKKEAKPKGPKLNKTQKAAQKEGGKKGQDLSGMCDIGGMTYFTVVMQDCGGEWDLLQLAMDGANKEVDPDGDDRKGGAHELIKCFMDIAPDSSEVRMLVNGKKSICEAKGLSMTDWLNVFLADDMVLGEIVSTEEDGDWQTIKAICKKNEEKELFPLKQRDAAINASFRHLKSLSLVASDSSGSEQDMGDLAEVAGFDW